MSHLVDLSHPVISGRSGYPGLPAPRVEPYVSHAASSSLYEGRASFEITRLFLVGNTGTYLDSPYHRYPDGADIADLPLPMLAAVPGACLDARPGPGGRVITALRSGRARDDLRGLAGKAVLIRTGWDRRYGTPAYWRPGPFLSTDLVNRLVGAAVALVGVDCWNVDDPADLARPAHTRLLGAGIPIVEHLHGLDRLPRSGFRLHAVPLAVVGAASMPVRAYAEIPKGSGRPTRQAG